MKYTVLWRGPNFTLGFDPVICAGLWNSFEGRKQEIGASDLRLATRTIPHAKRVN